MHWDMCECVPSDLWLLEHDLYKYPRQGHCLTLVMFKGLLAS